MQSKSLVRWTLFIIIAILCTFVQPFRSIAADRPQTPDQILRISVEELLHMMEQESVVIVDARVTRAWNRAGNKIPGAIRLDTTDKIDLFSDTTDQRQAIVAYCLCPQERSSAVLALTLVNQGFSRVWVLAGGYHAWISADLPLDEK